MIGLAQSSKRDFVVVAGRIQTVSDIEAAQTVIDNVVRSQLGEYRYNTTKGVDYEGNVFSSNPNLQLFEAQVRRNVLLLSFVEQIKSFEYNINSETKELEYSMDVSTIFGDTSTRALDDRNELAEGVFSMLLAVQNYTLSGINYAEKFNA
ncbi:hypothetical protein KKJFFJLC_00057 [Vibrio phage vB_VpaS_PGB]|nr:hypothetical protein HHKILHMN_00040 [Vibrio phage vB_VpaS_PGA]WVH05600.1 hypothetical protein KKJFFJLC_00057 [Vibrio phage vB_VpaS_PGB]